MRPDRLARLHGAVDRQAAEAVRVIPYTAGGYVVGGPDPKRPAQGIVGIVNEVPKTVRAQGSGSASGHNAELRTATHTVLFSTELLPYGLEEGDHVVLLERGDLELKLASASPFGTRRTLLRLEQLPALGA